METPLDERTRRLIAEFEKFLRVFLQDPPFRRAGQFEFHRQTIVARRQAGSVEVALASPLFLRGLYSTLKAWGIGRRAAKLVSVAAFQECLRAKQSQLAALQDRALDDPDLDVDGTAACLWELIRDLHIVENKTLLVSGTKTLHHLLPDLVVPIDRQYTQSFFGWNNPQFQYHQAECLAEAFRRFARIARAVNPQQFVDTGWNSSRSKVIDNAIIGFVRSEAPRAARVGQGKTRQTPGRRVPTPIEGGSGMPRTNVSIDEVWQRLRKREGEGFTTKRGRVFTYSISGSTFRPNHVNHQVSRADFAKALRLVPFDGPGVISKHVRGPAYVWAVLHDKRIRRQDW